MWRIQRVRAAHWTIAFITLAITLLASGWKGRWYSGKVDATIAEVCFLQRLYPVNVCYKPCISSSLRFDGSAAGDGPACHTLGEVLIWAYPPRWKAVFWFIAVSHLLNPLTKGRFSISGFRARFVQYRDTLGSDPHSDQTDRSFAFYMKHPCRGLLKSTSRRWQLLIG